MKSEISLFLNCQVIVFQLDLLKFFFLIIVCLFIPVCSMFYFGVFSQCLMFLAILSRNFTTILRNFFLRIIEAKTLIRSINFKIIIFIFFLSFSFYFYLNLFFFYFFFR